MLRPARRSSGRVDAEALLQTANDLHHPEGVDRHVFNVLLGDVHEILPTISAAVCAKASRSEDG